MNQCKSLDEKALQIELLLKILGQFLNFELVKLGTLSVHALYYIHDHLKAPIKHLRKLSQIVLLELAPLRLIIMTIENGSVGIGERTKHPVAPSFLQKLIVFQVHILFG